MQGPQGQKLRAINGSMQAGLFVKAQREGLAAARLKRFSVISGGVPAREAAASDSLHYLQELESENTKLRSVAIDLALEISALRGN
jgi:hypothetical protein